MGETLFLKAQVVMPVNDVYETTAWYERVLGFETRYIHGSGKRGEDFANYAIVGRDLMEVHFIMDEGGAVWTRSGTGYLYLTVSNVEAVYTGVKSQGVTISRELRHENWPARGFNMKDPSGNEVHIEQPI